jgi:hypothetical protein
MPLQQQREAAAALSRSKRRITRAQQSIGGVVALMRKTDCTYTKGRRSLGSMTLLTDRRKSATGLLAGTDQEWRPHVRSGLHACSCQAAAPILAARTCVCTSYLSPSPFITFWPSSGHLCRPILAVIITACWTHGHTTYHIWAASHASRVMMRKANFMVWGRRAPCIIHNALQCE